MSSSSIPTLDTLKRELQRLEAHHRELDAQLEAINQRPFLSAAEETERTNIKKLKLRAKDQIMAVQRQLQGLSAEDEASP